jgi:hypothetical protein
MNYLPENDGIDHINVYSKGRTELGRMLSNFYLSPFSCEDGNFHSIEGYWYWLLCDENVEGRDELKILHGYLAKKKGKELCDKDYHTKKDIAFEKKIKKAFVFKVLQNKEIKKEFVNSDLPLIHYYCYGDKVVYNGKSDWLIDYMTKARDVLKKI